MAESSFPGVMGAGNSNPFGSSASGEFGHAQTNSARGGMQKLMEEEEVESSASPTSPSFRRDPSGGEDLGPTSGGFAGGSLFPGHSGGASTSSQPPSSFPATASSSRGFPSNYAMGRRTSVSAESMNPSSDNDSWTPPVHQKTADQLSRLKTSIAGNFLFSHLDDGQTSQALGAFVEKPIPTKDIKVITQGDVGDYFYVVEKGDFNVYVHASGAFQSGPDGIGQKVATIGPGGSFGELALMYNAPRAATILSIESSSCLWALDRVTFRRILMDTTFQKRRMYESFLEEVPLLSSLKPYERSKIADALDTRKFAPGDVIIREGDPGEAFFLLESGEADCYKRGIAKSVKHYSKGDYFGELALLNNAPRAASVIATSEVKLATLGKDGFQRLLGPVEGIMRRNDPSKLPIEGLEHPAKEDRVKK